MKTYYTPSSGFLLIALVMLAMLPCNLFAKTHTMNINQSQCFCISPGAITIDLNDKVKFVAHNINLKIVVNGVLNNSCDLGNQNPSCTMNIFAFPGTYFVSSDWSSSIQATITVKEPDNPTGPSTGIASPEERQAVRLYPNPGKGKFYVSAPSTVIKEAVVYDLSGQKIKALEMTHIQQDLMEMDLTGQATGVYVVELVHSDGYIERKKLVVQ